MPCMVRRRRMMKALAIGSTILGSNLVPMLSAASEAKQEAAGEQSLSASGIKVTKILQQTMPDGKEVSIVTVSSLRASRKSLIAIRARSLATC
jgi:hypothetical protein